MAKPSSMISEAALERMICVVGCPRGGTTLSLSCLKMHDQILAVPRISHYMDFVWPYKRKLPAKLLGKVHSLPGWYNPKQVLKNADKETSKTLARRIRKAFKERDDKEMWKLYPLVYSLDQENRKERSRIECWADKSKCYKLEKIAKIFPQGKFVFVVRDPRASICSLSRKSEVLESDNYDSISEETLMKSCLEWREQMQRILIFMRRYPGRGMLYRFEDLLESPAATLNSVFRFAEVDEMSEEEILEGLDEVNYAASIEKNEKGQGLSLAPLERWRSHLDEKQICYIETMTRDTASKLGYDLEGGRKLRTTCNLVKRVDSWKLRWIYAVKAVFQNVLEIAMVRAPSGAASGKE